MGGNNVLIFKKKEDVRAYYDQIITYHLHVVAHINYNFNQLHAVFKEKIQKKEDKLYDWIVFEQLLKNKRHILKEFNLNIYNSLECVINANKDIFLLTDIVHLKEDFLVNSNKADQEIAKFLLEFTEMYMDRFNL